MRILAICAAVLLTGCGGGSSSDSSVYGVCTDAISDYAVMNNVEQDNEPATADANGDSNVFFVGVTDGVVKSASFNWGPSYDGCAIQIN